MTTRSALAASALLLALGASGALAACGRADPPNDAASVSVARTEAAMTAAPGPAQTVAGCVSQLRNEAIETGEVTLRMAAELDEIDIDYELQVGEMYHLGLAMSSEQLELVEERAPELVPDDGAGLKLPDGTGLGSLSLTPGPWTEADQATRAYHDEKLERALDALAAAGIEVETEASGVITVISQQDLRRPEVLAAIAEIGAEGECDRVSADEDGQAETGATTTTGSGG